MLLKNLVCFAFIYDVFLGSTPNTVLVNLQSWAEREVKGIFINLLTRVKRKALVILVNLPPRSKWEVKEILVNLSTWAQREYFG